MIFLLLLAIVFIFTAGPFVWRVEQIIHAKSVYDVQMVKEELLWLEKNAGFINNLEIIKDTKLWLELNVGGKDLESKLATYKDNKHQFWLYLLNLQEGNDITAQNILDKLNESSLKLLGKGLMLLAKGDAQQARLLLTNLNWEKLSNEEKTLGHLSLAKAAMNLGDYQYAQTELKAAQQINRHNPACLSIAFDLAIEEEQWTKAAELSQSIDAQSWRSRNTIYETKKAILAITEGNEPRLSDSLATLEELPEGEVYIQYVNGIQALEQGQLEEGKYLLTGALKKGLNGELKVDAQKALDQVIDRQRADVNLRAIVAETS